jgi:hypothetical protein
MKRPDSPLDPVASPCGQDEYSIYQKVQTGGKGKEGEYAN